MSSAYGFGGAAPPPGGSPPGGMAAPETMGSSQLQAAMQALAGVISKLNTDLNTNAETLVTLLTALERGTPAYPVGATTTNAFNFGANTTLVATLAGTAGVTNYISGFDIGSGGATAAAVVYVTVTGTIETSLRYVYAVPAGATTGAQPLSIRFPVPIPASGTNTSINVTLAALGAGNTLASVSVYGFRL